MQFNLDIMVWKHFLRNRPEFYSNLKKIYGATIGFHWFKKLYLKKLGLYNGEKRIKLISDIDANKIISEKILSKQPFMLARFGSVEFKNLFYEKEFDSLCNNAGFFPHNKKLLPRFREIYINSAKQIDILLIWNYLNHFLKKMKFVRQLRNVNSFAGSTSVSGMHHKWLKALEGKRILVIHPFKKTIEMQYKNMDKLKILPRLKKLEVIPAVQTIAGNHDMRFKTWFDALDWMKKEINKKKFDIALIGCGAYGLPLGAYVKSQGKQAIHLGGSLQLLFGIMGERWTKNSLIKTNKYWTRPLMEDTPKNNKKIEGGCYW